MAKTFRDWDVDQIVLFSSDVMDDPAAEGHVALDGTKMQANGSRHKAMSYGRMKKAETETARQVEQWPEKADGIDRLEDEQVSSDRRHDEIYARANGGRCYLYQAIDSTGATIELAE